MASDTHDQFEVPEMTAILNVIIAFTHVAAISTVSIQTEGAGISKLVRICRNTIAINDAANIPEITSGQATQLMKYAADVQFSSKNYESYVTSIGVAYSVAANGYYLEQCLGLLKIAFGNGRVGDSFVPKRDYRGDNYRTSQDEIAWYLCTIFERTHSRKALLVVLRVPGDAASEELLAPRRYDYWKKFPTMILELLSDNPKLIPQLARSLSGCEWGNGWKPRLRPSFKSFLTHKNPKMAESAKRLLNAYEVEAARNPN